MMMIFFEFFFGADVAAQLPHAVLERVQKVRPPPARPAAAHLARPAHPRTLPRRLQTLKTKPTEATLFFFLFRFVSFRLLRASPCPCVFISFFVIPWPRVPYENKIVRSNTDPPFNLRVHRVHRVHRVQGVQRENDRVFPFPLVFLDTLQTDYR